MAERREDDRLDALGHAEDLTRRCGIERADPASAQPDIGGGQAVFLGNGVLRGYRVTFDFQHHTLWLEK